MERSFDDVIVIQGHQSFLNVLEPEFFDPHDVVSDDSHDVAARSCFAEIFTGAVISLVVSGDDPRIVGGMKDHSVIQVFETGDLTVVFFGQLDL